MLHQTISLSANGRVYMNTYLHRHSEQAWGDHARWQPAKRPAVLILPGGAYRYCSDREAEPVAIPFFAAGFQAFVLYYSVQEYSAYPGPLEDVSKAIWEIRRNAEQWDIDPDQIAVGGFSAGGSLATMIGTQWNTPGLSERLGIPAGGNKPNALFPCYPLTGLEPRMLVRKPDDKPGTPPGSILTNKTPQLNTYQYVGPHTPPAFIWHTYEDDVLTVENPLALAQAYAQQGIPFELHIYQHGKHGLSVNTDASAYGLEHPVNVDSWMPLCISWLKKQFSF